jgi:hypothetical protein
MRRPGYLGETHYWFGEFGVVPLILGASATTKAIAAIGVSKGWKSIGRKLGFRKKRRKKPFIQRVVLYLKFVNNREIKIQKRHEAKRIRWSRIPNPPPAMVARQETLETKWLINKKNRLIAHEKWKARIKPQVHKRIKQLELNVKRAGKRAGKGWLKKMDHRITLLKTLKPHVEPAPLPDELKDVPLVFTKGMHLKLPPGPPPKK